MTITLKLNHETLEWNEVPGAAGYTVTKDDGTLFDVVTGLSLSPGPGTYFVTPVFPQPEQSNKVTIRQPTFSVAFGSGHSTWGGGWTTGPGVNFPYPNDVHLQGMTQIGAGSDGTGFVTPDNSLYVCANNFSGTPGQGYVAVPMQPVYVPTKVTGGIPLYPAESWINATGERRSRTQGPIGPVIDGHVKAVVGNGTNLFALLDNGRVVGWGGNTFAQLGNGWFGTEFEGIYGGTKQVVQNIHEDEEAGHFKPQYAPGYVLIGGMPQNGTPLEEVVAIASGHGFTLYKRANGEIWFSGWLGGSGNHSWEGPGVYARPLPEPIHAQVRGAIAITCQRQTCLALMPDGTVKAFGVNNFGQFGNGKVKSEEGSGTKVGTVALSNVIAIGGSEYHSTFLTKDGQVFCSGRNLRGECGPGVLGPGPAFTTPVKVLDGAVAIAVAGEPEFGYTTIGTSYNLALLSDGTVAGWGGNEEGQLCDGTVQNKSTPVKAQGITNAISIAACSTNGKAIISGTSTEAPSITAVPAEQNGVKGMNLRFESATALGWHVKWRHADPEPLSAEKEALGYYRVYQEKWKTSKLLPAETREYFIPFEPENWEAVPALHYTKTLVEVRVEEVSEPSLSGWFKVRTVEVETASLQ